MTSSQQYAVNQHYTHVFLTVYFQCPNPDFSDNTNDISIHLAGD